MKSKIASLAGLALLIPGLASAATLSVSPASQSVKVGDTFNVSVRLDTQGASIDGVDLHYLTFDPRILQVVDADPKTPGIQITADSLMPNNVKNEVDNSVGKILFSQVVNFGSQYKGSGILASVAFKAIKNGTANITFNFTPRDTKDSNVAAKGADILTAVVNGSYTVTGTGSSQPPAQNQPASQPAVTTPGNTTPDTSVSNPAPTTGTTDAPIIANENKSFWQIVIEMIRNSFTDFKNRLVGLFK